MDDQQLQAELARRYEALMQELPPEAIEAFEKEYWPEHDLPGNTLNGFVHFVASWAFVAGWKAHRDHEKRA
jgi:hypothetical protein